MAMDIVDYRGRCWQCGERVWGEVCDVCGEDTSANLTDYCWCCGAKPVVSIVESVEENGEHIRVGVCQQCISDHCSEYIVVESI